MPTPKSIAATDWPFSAENSSEAGPSAVPPATSAAAALGQALFLTEPGDAAAISIDDVHQGQLGDCFLLSSIGELAMQDPAAIQNMIHVNPGGTETVTLYLDRSGAVPLPNDTNLRAVTVTVSNVFPSYAVNNGATQDVVGGKKEIWAQVLEKAFATVEGGYGAIANGGNPAEAMEQLTGKAATTYRPANVSASLLNNLASAGNLITFDTANQANLPDNLIGNHAYMFQKVVGSGNGASVQLANPWGMDQPGLVSIAQFSRAFAEIDVGHTG